MFLFIFFINFNFQIFLSQFPINQYLRIIHFNNKIENYPFKLLRLTLFIIQYLVMKLISNIKCFKLS